MRKPIDPSMSSYTHAMREPYASVEGHAAERPSRLSRRTQLYARMERVRAFSRTLDSIAGAARVSNPPGAEPVQVGLSAALGPGDTLVATYAESAFAIAAGGDPRTIALRVVDRARGTRGEGTKRLAHPTARCIEACDFATNRIGLVTSIAVSDRLHGRRRALVCAIDAARADECELREAVQGAIEWRLPVVFAIETNRLLPQDSDRIARLARDTKLAYDEVWGFDPVAVTEAVHHAIAASMEADQPRLVEILTAYPKSEDDDVVRPFGEMEDPIAVFRSAIECAGETMPTDLVNIAAHARADMRQLMFDLANEHDAMVLPRGA